MTRPTEGVGLIDFYAHNLMSAGRHVDLDKFEDVFRYLVSKCGLSLNSPSRVQIACIDEAIARVRRQRNEAKEIAA